MNMLRFFQMLALSFLKISFEVSIDSKKVVGRSSFTN